MGVEKWVHLLNGELTQLLTPLEPLKFIFFHSTFMEMIYYVKVKKKFALNYG